MEPKLFTDPVARRRAHIRWGFALTGLLLALALAPGTLTAQGQALGPTFPLLPVADSGVGGTAAVAARTDGSSLVALAVAGMQPGASYRSRLHAGTCDQPSASFTNLAQLDADAAGTATAIVPVRFRGLEEVPLAALTDGEHVIVLAQEERVVACGSVPAVASPTIDLQGFIQLATSAGCTDRRNQLFVIDDRMVLWIAEGSCADASYSTKLFGTTPDVLLCRLSDSIAGLIRTCVDDTVRPLFDTIIANDQAPDLGLGPEHQVLLAWSAPPAQR